MAKIVFTFIDTTLNGVPCLQADMKHDIGDPEETELTPAIMAAALVIDMLEMIRDMNNDLMKAAANKSVDELLKSFKPSGKAN